MPKKGRRYWIYGAFTSKSDAKKRQEAGKDRFIVQRTIRGRKRYVVMKER